MGLELAKAFIRVRADSSMLGSDLQGTQSTVQSALKDVLTAIGGISAGVAATGRAAIEKGVNLAKTMERTTISFETMLGSAEKAQEMLIKLRDFTAKTPFEMPGVLRAAKTLLAFGVEQKDLLEMMLMLGDVSAGTGKNFGELAVVFGQVRAASRLMGQDLLQLINAGVPIVGTLAKQFNVADSEIKKMVSDGKIGFKDVQKAFQNMTGKGGLFFNLMEKQSRSLDGLISTLNDNIRLVYTSIGDALLPMRKAFTRMKLALVETFAPIVEQHKVIIGHIANMTKVVMGLVAAFLLGRMMARLLGVTMKKVFIQSVILIPLVLIGAALGALIAGIQNLIGWWKSAESMQKRYAISIAKIKYAWERIKEAFTVFFAAFMRGLNEIIAKISAFTGVDIQKLPETIGEALLQALEFVSDFVMNLSEWFLVIIQNWGLIWSNFPKLLYAAFIIIWDIIKNFVKIMPQLLGVAVRKSFLVFLWLMKKIGELFIALIKFIWDVMKRVPKIIKRAILGEGLGSAIKKEVGGALGKAFRGFQKGLKGEVPDLAKAMTPSKQAQARAKAVVGEVWDKLKSDKKALEMERPEFGLPKKEDKKEDAAAAADAGKAAGEAFFKVGERVGFRDYGKKIQDALLKPKEGDKDDKRNKLLEMGIKKQDELLKIVKEKGQGVLT